MCKTKEELEILWQELLEMNPSTEELIDLATLNHSMESRVLEVVKGRPMSSEELHHLMEVSWESQLYAAARLLEQRASNEYLRRIVESLPRLAKQAAERILEQNPTSEDFRLVLSLVKDHEVKLKAASMVLASDSPLNIDLRHVMDFTPSLQNEAATRLLAQSPDNMDLVCIILYCEASRETAWEMLVKRFPSANDLAWIEDTASLHDRGQSFKSERRDDLLQLLRECDAPK